MDNELSGILIKKSCKIVAHEGRLSARVGWELGTESSTLSFMVSNAIMAAEDFCDQYIKTWKTETVSYNLKTRKWLQTQSSRCCLLFESSTVRYLQRNRSSTQNSTTPQSVFYGSTDF